MSWAGAIRSIFFAIAAALMAAPAAAHSPYFTSTLKIKLPDGKTGELRLLHGDGIFRSDPVRAVVIDAEGRALARSPQSYAMAIRCDDMGRCKAYDLNRLAVSTPDPETFRAGEPVADIEQRWRLEQGVNSWGFATKRMSLGDLLAGHVAYLMDNKYPAFVPPLLTAFALTLVFGVLRPAPSRRLFDRIVWYAIIAAAFAIAGLLMLMSLLTLWVSGLPLQLWFALSTVAAMTVALLFYRHHRKQAAAAQ